MQDLLGFSDVNRARHEYGVLVLSSHAVSYCDTSTAR